MISLFWRQKMCVRCAANCLWGPGAPQFPGHVRTSMMRMSPCEPDVPIWPPPLRRPRGGAHQTSQFWRLMLSISVATCPPHRVLAPTFSGLVRTKLSLNSFLPRLPTGGGSPRDRARGPPPAAPLKRTSAGVHAVAVRPRGACMGPPSRSVTSISGHFQRFRSAR